MHLKSIRLPVINVPTSEITPLITTMAVYMSTVEQVVPQTQGLTV